VTTTAAVREAFATQAGWCVKLGSPFTARLLEGLGHDLDRATRTGRTVLDWPGNPDAHGDALALRLAGALNALVRHGRLAELAEFYPPNALPERSDLSAAALAAIRDADDEICAWLQFAPQTNEVARSGVLYPGMMQIAADTGLPLALFEVGASAGLNLIPDQYAYEFAAANFGRKGSPVTLTPAWSGPSPGGVAPVVHSRRGCDQSPIDIADDGHLERLLSYIWPDQPERVARLEAAAGLARDASLTIDQADAADWVDEVFSPPGEDGVVRVLFHSIAYQYFPEETKQRITARMVSAGAGASRVAPLAWLAFELCEGKGAQLTLRLWPGGDERVLATADPHVRHIEWSGVQGSGGVAT